MQSNKSLLVSNIFFLFELFLYLFAADNIQILEMIVVIVNIN